MRRHLVLLALLLAPLARSGAAEPVPFRECAFEWIPWASTVEEAKAQAKKEQKLVLAFVFPWDAKVYEAGYEGAERVRASPPVPSVAEAEAQRSRDPGFVKEQAALAALLGDPDLSALVARSFVSVRLRMHTWHFFDGGPGPFTDPLPLLGTSDRETRPPAVLVATAEGKLLHRIDRMGVFDPQLVLRTLLALLRKNPRFVPAPARAPATPRAAIDDLVATGAIEEARRRLAHPAAADEAWAAVTRARLDALQGNVEAAETALRGLPPSPDRDALLAEVWVRRAKYAEVLAIPGLATDRLGRVALAAAFERLGRGDEARDLWRKTLADTPAGPLAARAQLYLSTEGPRALEWETLGLDDVDPMLSTTVRGSGGEGAAVRYLLTQQDADGSWKDPRGGGGAFDLSVPRTALCVGALRAWRKAGPAPELDRAVERGTAYVHRYADAPTDLVWPLTYALHLELELLAEAPSADGRRRATRLLDALGRIEHEGGWTYTGPQRLHTFNTAPILLLLVRAKALGLAVDPAQIDRTSRFLERNRVGKSRVFHYGTTMEHMSGEKGTTDGKSTCMRSAACELALFAAGGEKDTRGLSQAVDLFFEHQASGRATQKIFESYVDVTSLQDSYRYFFGAWYAAQAIAHLPEAQRKKLSAKLAQVVLAAQEIDGSFVDSQMVGKSSSTALALLALAAVRAGP